MHLHKANTGQQVDSLVTCLVSSSITPAVNRNHFSNFRIQKKKKTLLLPRKHGELHLTSKLAHLFCCTGNKLFFFNSSPKRTRCAPICGSAQSSLQLHVTENKYHRSTDRIPARPVLLHRPMLEVTFWKNHDSTFNSQSSTAASTAKKHLHCIVTEQIDTKLGTLDSMHIL